MSVSATATAPSASTSRRGLSVTTRPTKTASTEREAAEGGARLIARDSSLLRGGPRLLTSFRGSTRLAPLIISVGSHNDVARAELSAPPPFAGGSHAQAVASPDRHRRRADRVERSCARADQARGGQCGGLERGCRAQGLLRTVRRRQQDPD